MPCGNLQPDIRTVFMHMRQHRFHFLLHSAALVEDALRRRLADLDVRPRQARILDALARMGEASQTELAREFDLTPASMSTMISRLLSAGYVTRVVDPEEARSNIIRLSELGRDTLEDVYDAWSDIDTLIEEKLGADRMLQLADVTRELRDKLGGRAPGSGNP